MILTCCTNSPLCHLIAVRKLFRVSYTHDVSLANDYETISTILSDPVERQKRFQWRYRLEWREPQRIMQTLSDWKGGLSYWVLFQGGVEDQLRKEFQASQQGAARRQGLTVLQRCEQELRDKPDAPRPDSRGWKAKAMASLAEKHEKDYQRGIYEVSKCSCHVGAILTLHSSQCFVPFLTGSTGRRGAADFWYRFGLPV